MPSARYSFIAIVSCLYSDALAGSPFPPHSCQVSIENCHLPRYLPDGEIARGFPPDSQMAIFFITFGTFTCLCLWFDSLLLGPLGADDPPVEPSVARAVAGAGTSTPSAAAKAIDRCRICPIFFREAYGVS